MVLQSVSSSNPDDCRITQYPGSCGSSASSGAYYCYSCGAYVVYGVSHFCGGLPPGVGVGTVPNPPITNIFALPECAFCDKMLEFGDKKLCKECRGVFEAWKFLTKRDDPDKEPGA